MGINIRLDRLNAIIELSLLQKNGINNYEIELLRINDIPGVSDLAF